MPRPIMTMPAENMSMAAVRLGRLQSECHSSSLADDMWGLLRSITLPLGRLYKSVSAIADTAVRGYPMAMAFL